jgi:hypothetical protein
VTDDHGVLLAQCRDQSDDVADEMKLRVRVVLVRRVRLSVAALIRRDDVIAGIRERGQLMAPRIPRLREAVDQQHYRPTARLCNVQADTVARDDAMPYVVH